MLKWVKSGAPWIWLTGGAVSISLLSVMGLMLLIGWKGLSYFWPAPLYQWETLDGERLVGQLYAQEYVPAGRLKAMNLPLPSDQNADELIARYSIKVANRELYPADFVSILDIDIKALSMPEGWAVIERTRNGNFYGKPVGYKNALGVVSEDLSSTFAIGFSQVEKLRVQINLVIETEFKAASRALESMRLEKRKRELNGNLNGTFLEDYERRKQQLNQQLVVADEHLSHLREQLNQDKLIVEDMSGQHTEVPLSQILDMWYPNEMTWPEKISHWGKQAWKFLSENPRESNSEGGVFPAIFGTVLMVIIMSIVVMPLGVVAAVYLHEYATNNAFTRVIRVAVINLAGVPSIVYGVFGLGFFVYTLGGSMDSLFYAERLPAPTFGTPGLLWSALTLAVLTLPVVIVSTEEGLTRIPSSVRHGSLALGATQFETLWRIVLPMASPAIITGLILAVARAAGEVAPLMLVGVVKLASSLPVDGEFPYLHLDRKFMHLGFHIYDVGFQTTNIEAARPLVYATSFLLITVIISLNLTAISIRNNLREKYRTLGQD
ncbi:phosphate ABC transporter permease PstA [uncultured Vibrio sp.]|uniref:phosphate ABC transporter permease PstA n=1 Tax=uncultured Vibrio sp. TaxID=114054 RepID=UPI00092307E7|nr:phosphate ABC transporter permease PstA [uncultured Vibrio sp.]OIQ25720.1 MAG: phosphate ABC transporter, permease protein PstA [Vibrio sp. MedPE-SWchi]